MRYFRNLPNLTGAVAAGKTVAFDLPVGVDVYHALSFLLGDDDGELTLADFVKEMRIKINGVTVQRVLGSQFHYLDEVNGNFSKHLFAAGAHDGANQCFLNFSQPWRRTAEMEDMFAWGTNGLASLQVEFDLADVLAETPSFEGFAVVEDARYASGPRAGQRLGIGSIRRLEQHNIAFNGAADRFNVPLTPYVRDLPIHRLHFFTDKIKSIQVLLDGTPVWPKRTKDELDALYTKNGLVPSATVFSVIFDYTQRLQDYLNHGGKNLTLEVETAAGAGNTALVVEGYAPPPLGA